MSNSRPFQINHLRDINSDISNYDDVTTTIISTKIWKECDGKDLACYLNTLPIKNLILQHDITPLNLSQIRNFFYNIHIPYLESFDCSYHFNFDNPVWAWRYDRHDYLNDLILQFYDAIGRFFDKDFLKSKHNKLKEINFSGNYLDKIILNWICCGGKIQKIILTYFNNNDLIEIFLKEQSTLKIIQFQNCKDFVKVQGPAIKLLTTNSNLREIHLPFIHEFPNWLQVNNTLISKYIINITYNHTYDNLHTNDYRLRSINEKLYPILFKNNGAMRKKEILIKNLITLIKAAIKDKQQDIVSPYAIITALPMEVINETINFLDLEEVGLTDKEIKLIINFIINNASMDTGRLLSEILKSDPHTDVILYFYKQLEKIVEKIGSYPNKFNEAGRLCEKLIGSDLNITSDAAHHLFLINIALDNIKKCINRLYDYLEQHKANILAENYLFDLYKNHQLAKVEKIINQWTDSSYGTEYEYIHSIQSKKFSINLLNSYLDNLVKLAKKLDKNYFPILVYCKEIEEVKEIISKEFELTGGIKRVRFNLGLSNMLSDNRNNIKKP